MYKITVTAPIHSPDGDSIHVSSHSASEDEGITRTMGGGALNSPDTSTGEKYRIHSKIQASCFIHIAVQIFSSLLKIHIELRFLLSPNRGLSSYQWWFVTCSHYSFMLLLGCHRCIVTSYLSSNML